MNEGGQSSTGQLIDFVLKTHPAYNKLEEKAEAEGVGIYQCKQHSLSGEEMGSNDLFRACIRTAEADRGGGL